jgi:ComF family protein
LQLKFYGRESWGRRLGAFLASLWDSPAVAESGRPSVVVPVPLHPARERERGFNQAEILCRGFLAALRRAQRQHLPQLETGCLRRLRATQTQSGLSFEKRLENVRGAFGVEAGDRLRGRAVLLVDDVMTTGATVSACAGVLKRAQAARVVVFTVARATPQVPAGLGAVGIDPVWPHGPVPLPDGQDRL